ncbi:MAG: type IV pili methyl-accepting chemotaxis transducer N-terminal domain-containing protein [Rhizobacter sp.]|nr:type IV pili methyl-accepting chemotaxis transducer N-terminal domain-containing protein [Rhizobacter sp.]
MSRTRHWSLGGKLTLAGVPFLLLALIAVTLTLWVSWQLDGGAAAVNEAGRLRMQSWRMAMSVERQDADAMRVQRAEFDRSLALLRDGDPERPLFVPWDAVVRARFDAVESHWTQFQRRWLQEGGGRPDARAEAPGALSRDTADFVAGVDAFVAAIEAHMSRWTALLYLCQIGMLVLAVAAAVVIVYAGFALVIEPVGRLKAATLRIREGDLGARVERVTSDEFGTLAEGFNRMADHLQSMYGQLEARVSEKTAELEEKRERLQALYEVTALVARATTLDELARGFVSRIARIAHADAAVVRWSDEANQRYLMLASEGLPEAMTEVEQCVNSGDCHCGTPDAASQLRVIPIRAQAPALAHCTKFGFATLVSVPVRLHARTMGEVDLFFHSELTLSAPERSLLEALASHLAGAMENLRLNALEMEAAVSQERTLLARELHDSIAQSLAFLKIQVQLMRDALDGGDAAQIQQVLGEIDAGVRESYGDVRELLVHFRTRANAEDMEPALATTLRKFEHQSGVQARLQIQGHGLPLSPEWQIQVLHIVQEALSNVRKHARAGCVWLDVQQQPQWRFEVRDDGIGFAHDAEPLRETHVGLGIMRERAERIGATLEVMSTPGRGTSVILTLPPLRAQPTPPVPERAETVA